MGPAISDVDVLRSKAITWVNIEETVTCKATAKDGDCNLQTQEIEYDFINLPQTTWSSNVDGTISTVGPSQTTIFNPNSAGDNNVIVTATLKDKTNDGANDPNAYGSVSFKGYKVGVAMNVTWNGGSWTNTLWQNNSGALSMMHDGTSYYYNDDALGSARNVTDADEDTENTYGYYAFGDTLSGATSENVYNVRRFTGRDYEPGGILDIHYMRHRYYIAQLGIFAGRDIMGADYFRGWGYASNNPLMFTDPYGLWEISFAGISFGYSSDTGFSFDATNAMRAIQTEAFLYASLFGIQGREAFSATWSGAGTGLVVGARGFDRMVPAASDWAFGTGYTGSFDANTAAYFSNHTGGQDFYRSSSYVDYQTSYRLSQSGVACAGAAAGLSALQAANSYFMPETLYHFTSEAGLKGIIGSGGIKAGSGLYGNGVYLTAFNNATMATVQGATSTKAAIAIPTSGLNVSATYFPGTYIVHAPWVPLP